MEDELVYVYCGDWNMIPDHIKSGLELKGWTTETEPEMREYAFNLVRRGSVSLFTNNEVVFHAIRVGVKRAEKPTHVRVVFYSENYPSGFHGVIFSDGNMNFWPVGLFDETVNLLQELCY